MVGVLGRHRVVVLTAALAIHPILRVPAGSRMEQAQANEGNGDWNSLLKDTFSTALATGSLSALGLAGGAARGSLNARQTKGSAYHEYGSDGEETHVALHGRIGEDCRRAIQANVRREA